MTGPTSTADQPKDRPEDRPESYVSPLPTPRPHLGHALASEWTKLVSVRSTLFTLGSLVVLVVGIGLLAVVEIRNTDDSFMPLTAPALFGLLIGQVAVMALGVLTITSEYGTGLIRTTFTAAPGRARVLTAKYLVFAGVAFAAVAGSVAVVAFASLILRNDGRHGAGEWVHALAGSAYVTLLGVLALAVGAMLRHSAGAIAVMLGLVTVPPVAGGMLTSWERLAPVGRTILEYNAPVALMQMFGVPNGIEGERLPSNWSHMLLILLVTGAAVAGSYVLVRRRDV
ncbi:ABC transporter permease subunit [Streptomyces sp. BR123]|uniref:ABC transporter permease subunit n=1 Tax=Streptomyces sp. BR123 TaxID=2749828 RepID=UPI0015C41D2B|nr:ABC transporter permease subunit [Streptomyces sp. BR123]NXY94325.1 ABC transporter permease subunit [Streptomyces sp. BR123]